MVLRSYDHNLNTDRKQRLWIWSGLFSVAFYENSAVNILWTAITWTRPTLHLCHKQSWLYFPLAFQTRPRWSLGFVQGVAAGACALQLPATTTCTIATFASFVSQTKLRRQVCTNCVIHGTYVSQRLTNLCFVPNPICHSPTGGRPTVTMPAPHPSFIQLCSFSPSFYATIPYNFWYLYYKIKNVTWWFAAVCLGRWKFVGPRRSSLHSVRIGQLLVSLCTSTHCQCNESVHRKEQLLFTPFMTV